ncbi:MAG: hypothetical protein HY431_01245 [Candidatus Levybacteria bacterium]|nr:hypothetical protein [Candidatus Levybacteria bacterium]
MLPKVFKRKLRIVVAGKTLFQQQRGDVGTFFVILIMATIIGGSYFLVNGIPSKFLIQDPLDPDKDTTYSLNKKKIAKGKKNALQLKDIPFVSNTPTPAPESREPNEPRDRPGEDTTRPRRPTRQPDENGVVITQPPAEPPDRPRGNSCGISSSPILELGEDESGRCCVMDGAARNVSECCPGVYSCDNKNPKPGQRCSANYNGEEIADDYPVWCDAKPIIYLYPTKPTLVDVVLTVPGEVVVSDPLYPVGGWKNVLAYPDGQLIYKGKTYKELFYEAAITPIDIPKNGIIVEKEQIQAELEKIGFRLGLIKHELADFVSFWTDRLSKSDSPYMMISVFSPEDKEKIDKVTISPTPDTFIQFIMYYKPLEHPYPIAPLILPNEPPKRIGFTAVEWGGILDD